MKREGRRGILGGAAAAAVLIVPSALLLMAPPSAGKSDPEQPDASKAFHGLFAMLEQVMGIDVVPSDIKLNLLQGQVTVGKIEFDHPDQGNFAIARNVSFPLGTILGISDSKKATTLMKELDISLDFGGVRFWKGASPGGGPVPGAPDLKMGKLKIAKGSIHLSHGEGSMIELMGMKCSIKNLSLPGKLWSQGKVPDVRWAEAHFVGGTVRMDGVPDTILLEEANFELTSTILQVKKLTGTLETGGKLSMAGRVDLKSGAPSGYDLVVDLDQVEIDRAGVEAIASGRLEVKGVPGSIVVGGVLDLTDIDTLRSEKWTREKCSGKTKLDLTLLPESGSKFKQAKVKGSICRGRVLAQ